VPRLFHMPGSRSNRVLWLLEEIGAPYEVTLITPPQRRSPEHLKRHPLGRVPALELDDGTIIFESAAILLQLGDLHPDIGLLPAAGSTERARAYQWILFAMTELEASLYPWLRAIRNGTQIEPWHRRFAKAAAALEAALGSDDWLLGEFTVADIPSVGVLGSAHSRGLLARWPALCRYVERGESRPGHVAATAIKARPSTISEQRAKSIFAAVTTAQTLNAPR
jgi:glutathione S-transferase